MDPYFRVEVISRMQNPQKVIYAAMHQDYSERFVFDELLEDPPISEKDAGDLVVKHLLKGGRGHYGPLEHPQIVFNCGWFPHSVMQQLRTHRVGISFDVQSFRYSGERIARFGGKLLEHVSPFNGAENQFAENPALEEEVEKLIYLRPEGTYTDRQGKSYNYKRSWREADLVVAAEACMKYAEDIQEGKSEEHARGLIPFDVRQHFVLSVNVRSLQHLLDLRAKKNAQLECQWFCDLLFPHFESWVPEIAAWYKENRLGKARLSP